jgi:uncharacterized metal-binding protein
MRGLAVGLAIIIGISLIGLCSCSEPATPETNGVKIMPDQILSSVMDYIKENHPNAAPFIRDNMSWTKSSQVIKVGYSRYVYTVDGWAITIGHAATAKVVYEVKAECAQEGIVWVGTIKDDIITEKSYTKK